MSAEYTDYIIEHRDNVCKGFEWLVTHIPEILEGIDIKDMRFQLSEHDKTKVSIEEYDAYDKYFYGKKTNEVEEAFNKAWLHHIHHNPHHWQHWVLINDDEECGTIAIEMPYNYVIEMICDWWSFSWKVGKLGEIFKWYKAHDNIVLHPKTREQVERILLALKRRLGLKD